MATKVIQITTDSATEKLNRFSMLAWLNKLLQTNLTHVQQLCSGSCHCQLMDWLFPGSIDISNVRFQAQELEDCTHNYSLLQEAFRKTGVIKIIPIEDLAKGDFRNNISFLKWFKTFFQANLKDQVYDPVKTRHDHEMIPTKSLFGSIMEGNHASHRHTVTVKSLDMLSHSRQWESVSKLLTVTSDTDDDCSIISKRTRSYNEQWKEAYKWAEKSTLGEFYVHCCVCNLNIDVHHQGRIDLKRHQQTKRHSKNVRKSNGLPQKEPLACMKVAVSCMKVAERFIKTHCGSGSGAANGCYSRYMLGLKYRKDLVSACQQTPYCVYLYGGVALPGADKVTVVLLGFFDVKAASHRIRLLDVVEESMLDAEYNTATALVEKLMRYGLSTSKLATFHLDGIEALASESICAKLRELNPNIVSLGRLYQVADAASHAGVMALSNQVQELLTDMHSHYSCSTKNENLKTLFATLSHIEGSPLLLTASCLNFSVIVEKMLEMWSDLVSYFCSCDEDSEKATSICIQLQDPKLRATFVFLDQAMAPLQAFQKKLQTHEGSARADLVQVFRDASNLLRTYSTRFLQPQAVVRYLKERDTQILSNKKFHLPGPKVNLGGAAAEDFLHKSESGEWLTVLQEEALSFYVALTTSITDILPLCDWVFRTMEQLLDPQGRLKVTGKAVGELGSTLGLCCTQEEVKQLTSEFLEYQLTAEGERGGEEEKGVDREKDQGGNEATSLEEHWSMVLEGTQSHSIFKTLILTLLALPCAPLEAQHVFKQVIENGDATQFSESGSTTESGELDSAQGVEVELETADTTLSESTMVSPVTNGMKKRGRPESKLKCLNWTVRPCTVRLQKLIMPQNEDSVVLTEHDINVRNSSDKDTVRGIYGWESSLRQKPTVRTVFQAGAGTWEKALDLDTDSQKCQESSVELGQNQSSNGSTSYEFRKRVSAYQDGKGYLIGELVWGTVENISSRWPGLVVPWKFKSSRAGVRKVEWFGDGTFSDIRTEALLPFSCFSRCFCRNSFASMPSYKEGIYQILELAGERCEKSFAPASNKAEEFKLMLDWAFGGFLPTGPNGFCPPDNAACAKSNLSDSPLSDYQPPPKKKFIPKLKAGNAIFSRDTMMKQVDKEGKDIEDFCISCGTSDTVVLHPLFEGSLCQKCKENFIETLYRYDEDGYQSYCTVCCAGLEVILCGNASCCRCFCKDCLNILAGPGTFDKLKDIDPWKCYMCKPSQCEGSLKLRPDWNARVQDLFVNNSAQAFEPHRIYPSIPADRRRPIRVLSLFDGIATGYHVLKRLGFKVERYIASEICEDSIAVGMIKHEGKIEYVNDVRSITRKHLAEWGPFDLLIGGSPCNDLSMVNPLRKGLFEGTGRLFFEYYRMLTMMKPKEEEDRPFFWLFENVVFMSGNDKSDICRFLECNPTLIDAVEVSPAHRARYFWGNLPGMNRPMTASLEDKVNLQDCLEIGRVAKFNKIRTITTKSNSMRQGKMGPLPVNMNGKDDYLWSSETEQIFGFPKHYTDVNNMGRGQRQKVLGRSWSVAVIRHLFAPLKDYFECE